MNASVGDQTLDSDSRDCAANRIVTRGDDRFRGVIDDDIDAGSGFDGADVAAFAPDDAPFHFVVGQRNHGDSALGYEFAGEPLDRDRHDPFGAAIGLLARFFLDHADMFGGLGPSLSGNFLDQRALGLFAGEAGNLFEFDAGLIDEFLLFGFFIGNVLLAGADTLIAAI